MTSYGIFELNWVILAKYIELDVLMRSVAKDLGIEVGPWPLKL